MLGPEERNRQSYDFIDVDLPTKVLPVRPEAGATEVLRFVPTEEAVMEKVVNLYDHKKRD